MNHTEPNKIVRRTWETDQTRIEKAANGFPPVFGLRGFPNKEFRIERGASYISEGHVCLYVYVLNASGWESFCKGTPTEVTSQLVPLEKKCCPVPANFNIKLQLHSESAIENLTSPQKIRDCIGAALDTLVIEEEIDYTLEVERGR